MKTLSDIVKHHKDLQKSFRESGDFKSAQHQGSLMRRACMSPESIALLESGEQVTFDEARRLLFGASLRTPNSATIDPDTKKILDMSTDRG